MTILPGLILALSLAFGGQYLSHLTGVTWMGMPKSPVSGIMMAILLGILLRNTIGLHQGFLPGVQFGFKRVLRLGIVLLGIRLSLGEVGVIGLQALPVIIGAGAGLVYQQFYDAPQALDSRRRGFAQLRDRPGRDQP